MESPILFSGELVQSIQEQRKTVTRRVTGLEYINRDPDNFDVLDFDYGLPAFFQSKASGVVTEIKCPYGFVGDKLWVRENWAVDKRFDKTKPTNLIWTVDIHYMADGHITGKPEWAGKTRPSIFLPRRLSRINLEITDIWLQRLHDITEDQAKAEGVQPGIYRDGPNRAKCEFQLEDNGNHGSYRDGFRYKWQQLNGRHSWDSNPWVWVINFIHAGRQ